MAKDIHVNGPCLVKVGPQGNAGALKELAISVDGVDLSFEFFEDDVIADSGGPRVPVDVQDLGKIAMVSFRAELWDSAILEGLMARGARAGNLEPAGGALLMANNRMNRLVLSSPTELRPWRFFYCHLMSPLEFPKMGTIRTMPTIRFRCLPGIGLRNTMADLPLFDHTDA